MGASPLWGFWCSESSENSSTRWCLELHLGDRTHAAPGRLGLAKLIGQILEVLRSGDLSFQPVRPAQVIDGIDGTWRQLGRPLEQAYRPLITTS
jgi:hypothetical protein